MYVHCTYFILSYIIFDIKFNINYTINNFYKGSSIQCLCNLSFLVPTYYSIIRILRTQITAIPLFINMLNLY